MSAYGYISIKPKNCFAKIVNESIIHYLVFKPHRSEFKGRKAVEFYFGIETIFSQPLDEKKLIERGYNVLYLNQVDESLKKMPLFWNYLYYYEENPKEAFGRLLDIINIIMRNIQDICSLENYISFCKKMDLNRLRHADELMNDSILLIKTQNHDSFQDVYSAFVKKMQNNDFFINNPDEYEIALVNLRKEIFEAIVDARDRVYLEAELHQKTIDELEARRQVNINFWKKCGLIK